MPAKRRFPIGAEIHDGGVHFRVWAPRHRYVEVVLESAASPSSGELEAESGGYFAAFVPGVKAGDRYRFRLGGRLYPDPASRFQPEGPHGPSQVVDPFAFSWRDRDWRGVELRGQVLYEMHIGTFTPEGTWAAAARELPELADLGVTVVEVMPVADFPGRFGWGYDGVNLFAPTRLYGSPDDFRRFVEAAQNAGIGVILDVVYNHVGPDGNYLTQFAEDYFSAGDETEWGKSINFDGAHCEPVREFFLANAGYWIDEFHLDGLRLDATQAIRDESGDHILGAIQRRVKETAGERATIVIHENEPQDGRMIRPVERGGLGLDGAWNDDFHHSAMVALTGRSEAYYCDYSGSPQEFISAAKYGYLLQGQRYAWQEQRRGSNTFDLEPWRFVTFVQNHDQVANSGSGLRCHQLTSPGRFRAMTALLLLGPGTPLLFQGEEFASSAPFYFFADHGRELSAAVKSGRTEFLRQFRSLDRPDFGLEALDPADPGTFARCKLDLHERQSHTQIYQFHKDLLAIRKSDPVIHPQSHRGVDGAVLGPNAFALRFFSWDRADRLLLVNFGADLHLDRAPEPLLAPPDGSRWENRWSSEDPRYGGSGTPPAETMDGWRVMGEAAVLLVPAPTTVKDQAGERERAKKHSEERKRRERTPQRG